MPLCGACMKIFEDVATVFYESPKHDEQVLEMMTTHYLREELRLAAEQQCYICTILFKRLYVDAEPDDQWDACQATITAQSTQHSWYHVKFEAKQERPPSPKTDIRRKTNYTHFVVREDDVEGAALGAASAQQSFTGSAATLQLAQHWLSKCLETHKDCATNSKPSWYPSRLLSIDAGSVKLVKTSQHTQLGPYATLSYCWGIEPFECLTTENIAVYEDGIATSALPPTLRDAVNTAFRLGINYIWIDSLCIIQSSSQGFPDITEEKLAEIRNMDKVYMNGILNLAAVHCKSPRDGLYVHRRPLSLPCRRFVWRPVGENPERIFSIRKHLGRIKGPDWQDGNNFLKNRAWVMQERLLATRILNFSDRMVYWECAELGEATELCPEGMIEQGVNRTDNGIEEPFSFGQFNMNAVDHRSLWKNIIEHYSRKKLTFPSKDKLLALSAIAAQAAAEFKDTYVVGMFRRDLLYYICWERVYDSETTSNWIPQTELPSWSWTAYSGEVEYSKLAHFNRHGEPLVSVVDVQIDLKDTQNPFGAINSAGLMISGRKLKVDNVSLMEPDEDYNDLSMQIAGTTHYAQREAVFWTEKDFLSVKDWLYFLPLFWGQDTRPISEPPENPFQGRWDNALCHFMEDALKAGQEGCKELKGLQALHGLLLVELLDGTFERVDLLTDVAPEVLWKWAEQADEHITLV